MFDTSILPNDIDLLKKIIFDKSEELERKDSEIEGLKDIINILQRKKYAPSSEVVPSNQLELFNELEEVEEQEKKEEEAEEFEEITYKRRKKRRPRIPDHLPRKEVFIDLPEDQKVCPHDGTALEKIGEDVSEQIEIVPAKVFVKKTIRPKYGCPCCKDGVHSSAPPPTLLPKSMASASLVAYIITAKFMDALPLYRQEVIFARISAVLTRQTMSRWLIRVSEQLVPLYNLLQDKLLEKDYLQMDETTTQVLKEEGKKATSKSYMWVRFGPGENPIVLFDYAPTRSGLIPKELLEGFEGYLQVDGYDGYAPFCRENPRVTRLGCLYHARRKFKDSFNTKSGKSIGKKALVYFKKLKKIEDKAKNCSYQQRYEIRLREAVPVLDELKAFLEETKTKVAPKSVAGKGINYTLNEWPYIIGYLKDGRIEVSNAWVENAIRPFAIGRKNWLFSTSVEGAQASAMYYSLIETAKANDIDPFDYLSKMLEKLPHAQTADDFEKLLPLKGHFTA